MERTIGKIEMKVIHKWSTPIAEKSIYLNDEYRKILIRAVVKHGANIFQSLPGESIDVYDTIEDFQQRSYLAISDYLNEAYNISIGNKYTIDVKAFGNHQMYGGRTYPHYHNHYDGVMVHYLTIGDEFKLNDDYDVIPLTEEDRIHKEVLFEEGQGYYAIQGDTKYRENSKVHNIKDGEVYEEKFPLQGSGKLILCDPRVGVSNLFSNKAISFTPKVGMTLLHPGYLWHESNTFTGNGIRVNVVVMFRVETR
tara:strand:+ start:242 stop:997 length:756 start_codon:yes stop_codon:yes gene_type:complete